MTGTKVLVVDDESDVQLLYEQYFFEQDDYHFYFARNGVDALSVLHENQGIDIILSDVNMPEMNGLSLLSKTADMRPDLKTIIVSAYGDMDNIRKAMNLGAYDFLIKPIDFDDLEKTLQKTMGYVQDIKQKIAFQNENDQLKDLNRRIRDRKHQLEAANGELQDINDTKNQFISIISHDLRAPISSLIQCIEVLLNEPDIIEPHERERHLTELLDISNNVLKLLDNLLQWSRMQRSMVSVRPGSHRLGDLVGPTMDLFATFARQKDISLELDQHMDPNIRVHVDPNMIETAFRNLISNALKFTHKGGRITVSTSTMDKKVALRVTDTGVGMKPAVVEKLFSLDKPTQRVGTDKEKGTGLGLILCKDYMDLNGGSIEVSSTPDQGSTFTLYLPNT